MNVLSDLRFVKLVAQVLRIIFGDTTHMTAGDLPMGCAALAIMTLCHDAKTEAKEADGAGAWSVR